MNKLFELRPISDPPKEDCSYVVLYDGLSNEPTTRTLFQGSWYFGTRECETPTHYLAPLAEPVEGMSWVNLNDRWWPNNIIPQFIRTIEEKLPINPDLIKYRYKNGKGYIHYDFDSVNGWHIKDIPFSNIEWLDESSTPSAREAELENIRKDAKELIEIIERFKYGESSSIFDAVSNFKQQHNL